MTIRELYEFATKNHAEDYNIAIQYRDDGGDYYGVDYDVRCLISEGDKEIIL